VPARAQPTMMIAKAIRQRRCSRAISGSGPSVCREESPHKLGPFLPRSAWQQRALIDYPAGLEVVRRGALGEVPHQEHPETLHPRRGRAAGI